MKAKTTLEELIKWQSDRAFKGHSEKIDIENFKRQFEGIPNEACHIFDCQTFVVHLIQDNFADVFGIPDFKPKNKVELLNLIHEEHLQYVMDFMYAITSHEHFFECGKDSVSQVYKISSGKMILITSTPLQMDNKNHVILVAEQYRDVTGMVPPAHTWNLLGPNAKKLTTLIQNAFKKDLPITLQELTVLSHIGKGYSSKETADILSLSKHTIDTHRRNILKKLAVANTNEALKKAIENSWLDFTINS